MPPGTTEVLDKALLDNWQSGLIVAISLFITGLVGWAFVFVIRRIYGNGGYKERQTVAEENVAHRQVAFIDYMQTDHDHRNELCTRHAAAIDQVAAAMREQSEHLGHFANAMSGSDGVIAIGQRLEATATELAAIAEVYFDRPWSDLSEDERQKVRHSIEKVKQRHARNRKD